MIIDTSFYALAGLLLTNLGDLSATNCQSTVGWQFPLMQICFLPIQNDTVDDTPL